MQVLNRILFCCIYVVSLEEYLQILLRFLLMSFIKYRIWHYNFGTIFFYYVYFIIISSDKTFVVSGSPGGGLLLHRDVSALLSRRDASHRQEDGNVPVFLLRNLAGWVTECCRKHLCRHGIHSTAIPYSLLGKQPLHLVTRIQRKTLICWHGATKIPYSHS